MSRKDSFRQKAALERRQKRNSILISVAAIFSVIAAVYMIKNISISHNLKQQFSAKAGLLEQEIFMADRLEQEIDLTLPKDDRAKYVVFISICDLQNRATVRHATGTTLKEAWDNAVKETTEFVTATKYDAIWVKADIVDQMEIVASQDLGKRTKELHENFFRQGIAFDYSFSIALLEAELNGNKIIDYDNNVIDMENLNAYLQQNQQQNLKDIPDKLSFFSCRGYFCDHNNEIYQLYSNDIDYGRRKVEVVDQAVVKDLIYTNSQFLANALLANGQFIYGYYPTYDNEITNYNILRHTGATWSLIAQYKIGRDESLLPKIDSAINYLVEGNIAYPSADSAFVIETKADEVKLGGNAIAIIMLIDYMQEFQSEKYKDLVVKLGNGILQLQNQETGQYYHVLNSVDYSPKEETRSVYYDGEATFALAKLYGFVKEPKYLAAAQKAADYFIANDYTQYVDHWVAYSMNEITKYSPEQRYFEFALQNVQNNLDEIYEQKTTSHIYLELLMATFELFDRVKIQNIPVDYLQVFDHNKFIDTIYHRARLELNGYLYPEYAMYLKNPARIVNTFCIRQDGYRIRIDDIQHFVGGYYYYYNYYDKLAKYKTS